MTEEDKSKTAFITDSGFYEFNVMSWSFQRYKDMVLAGLKWTSLLVHSYDVCIFSRTLDEHLQRLESAFKRFKAYKSKLNAENVIF